MKGVATPGAWHSVEMTTCFVSKQQAPPSFWLCGVWCFGALNVTVHQYLPSSHW